MRRIGMNRSLISNSIEILQVGICRDSEYIVAFFTCCCCFLRLINLRFKYTYVETWQRHFQHLFLSQRKLDARGIIYCIEKEVMRVAAICTVVCLAY